VIGATPAHATFVETRLSSHAARGRGAQSRRAVARVQPAEISKPEQANRTCRADIRRARSSVPRKLESK